MRIQLIPLCTPWGWSRRGGPLWNAGGRRQHQGGQKHDIRQVSAHRASGFEQRLGTDNRPLPCLPETRRLQRERLRRGRADQVRQQEHEGRRQPPDDEVRGRKRGHRQAPVRPSAAQTVRGVDGPSHDQELHPGHVEQAVRLRRGHRHRRAPRDDLGGRRGGGPRPLRRPVPAVPRLLQVAGRLRRGLRPGDRRDRLPDQGGPGGPGRQRERLQDRGRLRR